MQHFHAVIKPEWVEVTHYRYSKHDHNRLFSQREVRKGLIEVEPRGGRTVVTITVEGEEFQGFAYCSRQDGYNKKLGAMIALGRAKKMAWEEIRCRPGIYHCPSAKED